MQSSRRVASLETAPGFDCQVLGALSLRGMELATAPPRMGPAARLGPDTAAVPLNAILEKQVRRMAQELHDEAGQLMAAVYIKLAGLAREVPPGQTTRLQDLLSLLDEVEARLRRLSHELHPTVLDDFGLVAALEFLIDGIAARSGLAISFRRPRAARLPAVIETAVYRIVQEALSNVTRHACARHVWITLAADERVRCAVRDDGVGFDTAARASDRYGLTGIQARVEDLGGQLAIRSGRGRGTELVVTLPLG